MLAGSSAADFVGARPCGQNKGLVGFILSVLSIAALFFYMVFTSLRIGFPMIANMHGALALYSLCLVVITVFKSFQKEASHTRMFTGLVKMLAAVLMGIQLIPGFPPVPQLLQPILRSSWLVIHISLATAGEALFTCSVVACICWFISRDNGSRRDMLVSAHNFALAGFSLYTLGAMVLGMVWAYEAWGTPWNQDPKEVWALVTWSSYAACLHLNRTRIPEKAKMIILMIAFLIAMTGLFGANLLMRGLHSY